MARENDNEIPQEAANVPSESPIKEQEVNKPSVVQPGRSSGSWEVILLGGSLFTLGSIIGFALSLLWTGNVGPSLSSATLKASELKAERLVIGRFEADVLEASDFEITIPVDPTLDPKKSE